MTSSFTLDPLALLRNAVNRLETSVNAIATDKMQSAQFSQLLARLMKLRVALQHLMGQALARLYARLDIPSRTELAALAAAVQRIEDKVNALLPPAPLLVARPSRTRRAPEPAAAAPVAQVAPAAAARRVPARKAAAKASAKSATKPTKPTRPTKAAAPKPRSRRTHNGEARP